MPIKEISKFNKSKVASRKIISDSIHKGMAKNVGHMSKVHSMKSKTKSAKDATR